MFGNKTDQARAAIIGTGGFTGPLRTSSSISCPNLISVVLGRLSGRLQGIQ